MGSPPESEKNVEMGDLLRLRTQSRLRTHSDVTTVPPPAGVGYGADRKADDQRACVMSEAVPSRRGRRGRRAAGILAVVVLALGVVPLVGAGAAWPLVERGGHGERADGTRHDGKLLFFASDGLRQEAVQRYAAQGVVPGFRKLLRRGARASGDGLLTQAPPNTGAGWATLQTGAWPGVHGLTNSTFHAGGQPFAGSTSAFGQGLLQAETLAQAAERGGKKVVQIEWAGGRGGAIEGPTLDFRNFRSGRGVATNYISPSDSPAFTRSFGLQFDHPDRFAGQAPFREAARPRPRRVGRTCPRPSAHRRRCACACSMGASTSTG
jgi:Type I phosphodiesterase / nucleotide pyrophosphatase